MEVTGDFQKNCFSRVIRHESRSKYVRFLLKKKKKKTLTFDLLLLLLNYHKVTDLTQIYCLRDLEDRNLTLVLPG